MRIDIFIVSLFLAVLFLIGGTMIIDENMDTYNVTVINKLFENVSVEADRIYNDSKDSKDEFITDPVDQDETENNLFIKGWNVVTNVWQYFTTAGKLVYAVGQAMGIPPIFMDIFLSIIMVLAIFSLVYLIFRFMPR